MTFFFGEMLRFPKQISLLLRQVFDDAISARLKCHFFLNPHISDIFIFFPEARVRIRAVSPSLKHSLVTASISKGDGYVTHCFTNKSWSRFIRFRSPIYLLREFLHLYAMSTALGHLIALTSLNSLFLPLKFYSTFGVLLFNPTSVLLLTWCFVKIWSYFSSNNRCFFDITSCCSLVISFSIHRVYVWRLQLHNLFNSTYLRKNACEYNADILCRYYCFLKLLSCVDKLRWRLLNVLQVLLQVLQKLASWSHMFLF